MSQQTQGEDILFSSPEEDSSLYFTYSGGCNEVEVRNLNYDVSLFTLYSFYIYRYISLYIERERVQNGLFSSNGLVLKKKNNKNWSWFKISWRMAQIFVNIFKYV